MKNYLLSMKSWLLMGMMLSVLVACNKDDEDAASSEAKLIGTWNTQSVTFEVTINGEDLLPYLAQALGITEAEAQGFYDLMVGDLEQNYEGNVTINSDGTYESSSFGDEGGDTTGTWALSSDGKKLTLDAGTADEVTADIVELTSSTLKLLISETEQTDDMDGDGNPEELAINVTMTMTK
jgi:hypothetical protein